MPLIARKMRDDPDDDNRDQAVPADSVVEANFGPSQKSGFKKVFKSFELPTEEVTSHSIAGRPLRKRRYPEPQSNRRRKHKARAPPPSISTAVIQGAASSGLSPPNTASSAVSDSTATTSRPAGIMIPNSIGTHNLVDDTPINPLIPVSIALMVFLGMLVLSIILCGLIRQRRHRLLHSEDALGANQSTPDLEKRSRAVRRSSTLTSFASEYVEHPGTHSTPRVQVTPSTPTRPVRSSILGPPLPVMQGRRVSFVAPATPEYTANSSWTPDTPRQWDHPQIWSHLDYRQVGPAAIDMPNPVHYHHSPVMPFQSDDDRDEAYDGLEHSDEAPYTDRFSFQSTSSDSSAGSSSYTTASDGASMPETPVHSHFSSFDPSSQEILNGSPVKDTATMHPGRARSHTVITIEERDEQIGVRISQVARVEQEIAALEDLLSSESGMIGRLALPDVEEIIGDEQRDETIRQSASLDSVDELGTVEDVIIARPETRCEMIPPLDFQFARTPSGNVAEELFKLVSSPSRVARANTFPTKLLARRFSHAAAAAVNRSGSPPPLMSAKLPRRNSLGSVPISTAPFLIPLATPSATTESREAPPTLITTDKTVGSLAPSISHRFSACSWDEYLDSLDLYHRGTEMEGTLDMEEIERRRLTIKSLDLAKFPMPSTELPSIRVTSH